MSSDKTEAERKFWASPELVETLLPFLDVKSILCLAQCHQLTLKTLQGSSVWYKLVRRSCPEAVQMVRAHPLDREDTLGVRERLAPERLQMVHLVDILKMVEDPKTHLKEVVHVIFERFIPFQDGPRLVQNLDDDGGPPDIDLNSLYGPQLVQVTCSEDKTRTVSLLGYLLLKEIEDTFGSTEHKIEGIVIDFLEEPWLSTLSLQKERAMGKFDTYTVRCDSKRSAEVISLMIQGCPDPHIHELQVMGKISAVGWSKLARVLQSKPEVVRHVETTKGVLNEGRREDLRDIWEALGPAGSWGVLSVCRSSFNSFYKDEGEEGWGRLLDDLRDMECKYCGCGGIIYPG